MQNGSTVLVPICHYFEEKKFSKCNLLRQSKKISIIIRNETTKRNFLNLGKNQ